MSKKMFPILLLLALYGCSEKDTVITPTAPQHYLVAYAPVISISQPPLSDTVVTIKVSVSADDDPRVVAWADAPLTNETMSNSQVSGRSSISVPSSAKRLVVEYGAESYIEGQRFKSGTVTILRTGVTCVTVVASWNNGPMKCESAVLN